VGLTGGAGTVTVWVDDQLLQTGCELQARTR
jgi:hypothetical protein